MTVVVERVWTSGRVLTLVSLAITASAFAFTNVMMAPLLPAIQAEFDQGPAFGGLVFNISLATAGAATPLVVIAAGRLGNRAVVLGVLGIFSASSLLIGLSSSAEMLVFSRAPWGLVGTLLPCSYALARILFVGRAAFTATALLSGIAGISGGLGLIAIALTQSDLDTVALTWWLGTGVVAIVLVTVFVPSDRPTPEAVERQPATDVSGVTRTSLGVLLILLPLLSIDWVYDHPIWGAAGLAAGIALLWTSSTSRVMIAPNPTVLAANTMNVLGIAGFFALYVAVPTIAIEVVPLGPFDGALVATAMILLFPSAASLIGSQITGRLIQRGDRRWSGPGAVTFSGLCAVVGLVLVALSPTTTATLIVGLTIIGFGTGGAFNGIVETVSRSGPVAARTGTLVAGRYIGGAVGGAIVATALEVGQDDLTPIDSISIAFVVLAGLQLAGTAIWAHHVSSSNRHGDRA